MLEFFRNNFTVYAESNITVYGSTPEWNTPEILAGIGVEWIKVAFSLQKLSI